MTDGWMTDGIGVGGGGVVVCVDFRRYQLVRACIYLFSFILFYLFMR